MGPLSRREFAAVAAGGAAAAPAFPGQPADRITAAEVVDRIRRNAGGDWKDGSVDTFKAGDPATVVTGIVTTAMATLAVLQSAVTSGANLVITCEPTFFSKGDAPNPPVDRAQRTVPDAVFASKRAFIEKNGLVVWRFHDHWKLRAPDPLCQGLAAEMVWTKYQIPGDASRFNLPPRTLEALAAELKRKLGIRGGIRVVGDRRTIIRGVGLLTGSTPLASSMSMMPGVDAVIAGEVREWEAVEYAQDLVTSGVRKGLILLGRVVSEEPGMKACAGWLRTVVPEIPVRWIAAGDPYWRPA